MAKRGGVYVLYRRHLCGAVRTANDRRLDLLCGLLQLHGFSQLIIQNTNVTSTIGVD